MPIGDESSESPDSSPGRPVLLPRQPLTGPSPQTSPLPRLSECMRRGRRPSTSLPTSLVGPERCTFDSGSAPETKAATSRATSAPTSAPAAGETPTAPTSARRKRKASELDPSLPPPQPQLKGGQVEGMEQAKKSRRKRRKASASSHEELAQERLGSDSSPTSSPLREPRCPLVPRWTDSGGKILYGFPDDPAIVHTYHQDFHKYREKQARQQRLPTLSHPKVSSLTGFYSPKQKKKLLDAAKSVLILSAHHGILSPSSPLPDGKEINRCTRIVFEQDEVKDSTIILTSAWIICSTQSFNDWSNKDYVPEAKVIVHMLDGTTSEGQLLYFNRHYDFAFFEIMGGPHLQILSLESSSEFGQDLCVLARDKDLEFVCRRATVKSIDPREFQHNHYQFIDGTIPKCSTGGALSDFDGKIVGMLFNRLPCVAFVSSFLIVKCLSLWRKFWRVARPQLGLKLWNVGFQDISHVELLSRNFGIDSGLIVGEVSEECVAERLGIRVGDVILSCQGESVRV